AKKHPVDDNDRNDGSNISFSSWTRRFSLHVHVWLSGLKLKYVNIDDMTICYGEKGKRRKGQPSMILLHGFTACKFMWSPLAKNLSHDCHVIAVDLPGHGDSDTPTEDEDISHTTTVKKMNQIICRLGLEEEPFHLVGMSMGGALAGLYAAQYPEHIHSLTLICPAMRTPIESPFWGDIHAALEQGMTNLHEKCTLLFPQSAHQVQDMLRFVQFNNSWVPKQILQGVVDFRKNYYPFYARYYLGGGRPGNSCIRSSSVERTVTQLCAGRSHSTMWTFHEHRQAGGHDQGLTDIQEWIRAKNQITGSGGIWCSVLFI
ncbi:ABH6B-like protein, partial [Mya arenaria]